MINIVLRAAAVWPEIERLHAAGELRDDIHREVAARIFGVGYDAVTPEQRRLSKIATFGLRFCVVDQGIHDEITVQCSPGQIDALCEEVAESHPAIFDYVRAHAKTEMKP